ncbi:putative ABC transporter permease [Clostridium vincentii]|uniref:ABC-transporter type IV n=1 Tax=Clostridium vincentii TaxID=52704 RepID=A0A2T0BDM0_9CLOT|nr:hypothetical protein [Clostridium vincentii]PRR81907.1 hypothetical protein CLVI_21140 [Clostridium vincentii]
MRYWKNKIVHFFAFGSIYLNIEVFSKAYTGELIGFDGISKWSLCGWTSSWMFLVGGLCGVILGSLNDSPKFYNLKMWQQVFIGGTLIIVAEFLSGIFFNLHLHLNLWDYSQQKFNFLGQICLQNSIYWYLLSIVVLWFNAALSYYFYHEEKPPSLFKYFIKLITLK